MFPHQKKEDVVKLQNVEEEVQLQRGREIDHHADTKMIEIEIEIEIGHRGETIEADHRGEMTEAGLRAVMIEADLRDGTGLHAETDLGLQDETGDIESGIFLNWTSALFVHAT